MSSECTCGIKFRTAEDSTKNLVEIKAESLERFAEVFIKD